MRPDPVFPSTRQWEVLNGLIASNGWKRGAEIGVLKGRTTRNLLAGSADLFLILVDQWKHLPPSKEPGAEHYQRFSMAQCEAKVRDLGKEFPARIFILKGDSVEMAGSVADGSLDFVFIDAAHTEKATRANIQAWRPKVKKGGMITGHDWNWPSVARALDAELPGWNRRPEAVWTYQL